MDDSYRPPKIEQQSRVHEYTDAASETIPTTERVMGIVGALVGGALGIGAISFLPFRPHFLLGAAMGPIGLAIGCYAGRVIGRSLSS